MEVLPLARTTLRTLRTQRTTALMLRPLGHHGPRGRAPRGAASPNARTVMTLAAVLRLLRSIQRDTHAPAWSYAIPSMH